MYDLKNSTFANDGPTMRIASPLSSARGACASVPFADPRSLGCLREDGGVISEVRVDGEDDVAEESSFCERDGSNSFLE